MTGPKLATAQYDPAGILPRPALQRPRPAGMGEPEDDGDAERITEAARQFESLLIAGILKSVREAALSPDREGDQAGTAALEMAEEQMANVLAQNGGFGLARLLVSGLGSRKTGEREKPGASASKSSPPQPAPGSA